MKTINKYIYPIIFSVFFISCSDNSVFDIKLGETKLHSISHNTTFPTDTLKIFGNNIPRASAKNFLVFNDSIIIPSTSCLKWNYSTIELIIPDSIKSGKLYAVFGKDTSEAFYITVLPYPPFNTISIPNGNFIMGSQIGLDDELPIRNVELSNSLIVFETEVSQRLYQFITEENPSAVKRGNLPVNNLSWKDAVIFCNLLSEIDELKPAYLIENDKVIWDTLSNGWRLPTEAEWEYIARAGEYNDFVGYPLADFAWFNTNSGGTPHSIGIKKANKFGLKDVLGNVREWCWDYYDKDYYSRNENYNPTGPENGTSRVSRGGSATEGTAYLRLSSRRAMNESSHIGIRPVRNK